MGRMSRSERTELWQQRIDRYAQSNQTVAAFCQAEGISAASLYQWKRRLIAQPPAVESPGRNTSSRNTSSPKRESVSTPFAELVVMGQSDVARAQLPNGILISFGRDIAVAAAIVDRLVRYEPANEVTESTPTHDHEPNSTRHHQTRSSRRRS